MSSIEHRIEQLEKQEEQACSKKDMIPSLLFVYPGENEEAKIKEHEAKYGVPPAVVLICPTTIKREANDSPVSALRQNSIG